MRPFKTQVEAALLRGIAAAAGLDHTDRQKPTIIVEEIESVDWCSITFVGARHMFALRLDGDADSIDEALQALALRLPDWEFRIGGHIVADIELSSAESADPQADDGPQDSGPDEAGNRGPSTVSRSFIVNALTIID